METQIVVTMCILLLLRAELGLAYSRPQRCDIIALNAREWMCIVKLINNYKDIYDPIMFTWLAVQQWLAWPRIFILHFMFTV